MELKDIHHYTSYEQSISFENKHSWKKDAKPLTKHYQRLMRFIKYPASYNMKSH